MRKGFLNARWVYLAMFAWSLYRVWASVQEGQQLAMWIWLVLATVILGLYVAENAVKKRKEKEQGDD